MKKIAVFCIPAHGHTNPILPVVSELVRRGDNVRFYSFDEFGDKISSTGAAFISCNRFMPELSIREEERLKQVSATEMAIQDIHLTLAMDEFLQDEFAAFRPDVVYSDSVCFWGKLNAWKYDVPLVVSTSTFAFNQLSSQYMKHSFRETAGLILGLPKVSAELNKLRAKGYKFRGLFSLIQSDNDTDSVVYTSRRFQPYAESFSDHYTFVGPSVFSDLPPRKNADRPLVYVSMGTVINDRPDFYAKVIKALKDEKCDVIISCGKAVSIDSLGELPANVAVHESVDQLEVLSRACAFITHCGMNSVSESLYMATPMVLYPQTNEQAAVARRAREIGAGEDLKDDSAEGIRKAVLSLLGNASCAEAAKACSDEFRSCSGVAGAADFIESAPHASNGVDVIKKLKKATLWWQIISNALATLIAVFLFRVVSVKYLPVYILAKILISPPLDRFVQNLVYKRLVSRK